MMFIPQRGLIFLCPKRDAMIQLLKYEEGRKKSVIQEVPKCG
jgi:hypothetical protein